MKRSYFTGRLVKSGPTVREQINNGTSERLYVREDLILEKLGNWEEKTGGEGNSGAKERKELAGDR